MQAGSLIYWDYWKWFVLGMKYMKQKPRCIFTLRQVVFYLIFLSWIHVEVNGFSMVQWSIWTSVWWKWNLDMAWKSRLGALPHGWQSNRNPASPQSDSIHSHCMSVSELCEWSSQHFASFGEAVHWCRTGAVQWEVMHSVCKVSEKLNGGRLCKMGKISIDN